MDLSLCKVNHPQAHDNYRVVLRADGDEIEMGSIGIQFEAWVWGIDTAVPMRDVEAEGTGKDRRDCMRQFRAAWVRFSADQARLNRISRNEAEATAISWSRPVAHGTNYASFMTHLACGQLWVSPSGWFRCFVCSPPKQH